MMVNVVFPWEHKHELCCVNGWQTTEHRWGDMNWMTYDDIWWSYASAWQLCNPLEKEIMYNTGTIDRISGQGNCAQKCGAEFLCISHTDVWSFMEHKSMPVFLNKTLLKLLMFPRCLYVKYLQPWLECSSDRNRLQLPHVQRSLTTWRRLNVFLGLGNDRHPFYEQAALTQWN